MSTAIKQFSRISMASATNLSKSIAVVFSDGVRAEYPYCWLRDICSRPSLVHLDVNTRPKAIECTSNSLRVMWPPFLTSNFSSEFLREHAINHPSSNHRFIAEIGEKQCLNANLSKSDIHMKEQIWMVVSNKLKINENLIMGSFEWGENHQEAGTVWPFLDVPPSYCILEGSANIIVVDSFRALTLLQQICPKEFNCLVNSPLEYEEGLFRAKHPICTTKSSENGKEINSTVFNNSLRLSVCADTSQSILESLHKFGRICAELSQIITLNPNERLIVNNKRVFIGKSAQRNSHATINLLS